MTEAAQPPEQRKAVASHSGLAVLNASTTLTVQRTIVEAFVKLVVCRKITVQRVAAANGQVLDSSTTQEEEAPVILDVHRHEVGDVLSALNTRCKSPSNPLPHPPHGVCGSSRQQHPGTREQQGHTRGNDWYEDDCHGTNQEWDTHGTSQSISHPSSTMVGSNTEAASPQTDCRSEIQWATEADPSSAVGHSAVQGAGEECGPAGHDSTQQCSVTQCEHMKAACVQPQLPGKKRKLEDATIPVNYEEGQTQSESDHSTHMAAAVDHNGSLGCSQTPREAVGIGQQSALSAAILTTETATMWAQGEEGMDSCQTVEDSAEHDPLSLVKGETTPSQLKKLCAIENRPLSTSQMPDGSVQGSGNEDFGMKAVEKEVGVSDEEKTEKTLVMHDTCGTSAEMSFDVKSEERMSVHDPAEVETEASPQCAAQREEEANIALEQEHKQEPGAEGEVELCVQVNEATVSNEGTEADDTQGAEEYSGEAGPPDSDPAQMHQASEEDADQDMLVIDISSSVSEPSSQVSNSDTADAPQEQRKRPAEKPDPFHHLLTSFPPLGSSQVSQACGKGASDASEKNRNAVKTNLVTVKEEQDDDCMITAAFISPSVRRKNFQGPRSASQNPASHTMTNQSSSSHTLTNQRAPLYTRDTPTSHKNVSHTVTNQRGMLVASAGGMRREVFGRSPQPRQPGAERFGQFRVSPMQQFPQSAAGEEMEDAQGAPYHSSAPRDFPPLPNSSALPSKPYVPNFLASVGQPVPHADTAAGSGQHAEGVSPIDYSQQTYQCNICCKIFLHRHKFERHSLMCGGFRPFKCKLCSKGFNQRAHLDTHMKFHLGIKRYRCEPCRKAYVMKGDLIRHLKTQGHRITVQSHI